MKLSLCAVLSLAIASAATLVLAPVVQADTVYTDQASFLAAIQPGYYLETFDSLPGYGNVNSPTTFSGNGFSYDASAPGGLFGVTPVLSDPGDIALSTFFATTPVTLTFTGSPVTAVGGLFFPDFTDGTQAPGDETITLDDGTTLTLTATSGNPQPFGGFTSSIGIASLTVTVPANFPTINNLYVGTSAVPEPSTYALLGSLGLTGAAFLRRKRRTR